MGVDVEIWREQEISHHLRANERLEDFVDEAIFREILRRKAIPLRGTRVVPTDSRKGQDLS